MELRAPDADCVRGSFPAAAVQRTRRSLKSCTPGSSSDSGSCVLLGEDGQTASIAPTFKAAPALDCYPGDGAGRGITQEEGAAVPRVRREAQGGFEVGNVSCVGATSEVSPAIDDTRRATSSGGHVCEIPLIGHFDFAAVENAVYRTTTEAVRPSDVPMQRWQVTQQQSLPSQTYRLRQFQDQQLRQHERGQPHRFQEVLETHRRILSAMHPPGCTGPRPEQPQGQQVNEQRVYPQQLQDDYLNVQRRLSPSEASKYAYCLAPTIASSFLEGDLAAAQKAAAVPGNAAATMSASPFGRLRMLGRRNQSGEVSGPPVAGTSSAADVSAPQFDTAGFAADAPAAQSNIAWGGSQEPVGAAEREKARKSSFLSALRAEKRDALFSRELPAAIFTGKPSHPAQSAACSARTPLFAADARDTSVRLTPSDTADLGPCGFATAAVADYRCNVLRGTSPAPYASALYRVNTVDVACRPHSADYPGVTKISSALAGFTDRRIGHGSAFDTARVDSFCSTVSSSECLAPGAWSTYPLTGVGQRPEAATASGDFLDAGAAATVAGPCGDHLSATHVPSTQAAADSAQSIRAGEPLFAAKLSQRRNNDIASKSRTSSGDRRSQVPAYSGADSTTLSCGIEGSKEEPAGGIKRHCFTDEVRGRREELPAVNVAYPGGLARSEGQETHQGTQIFSEETSEIDQHLHERRQQQATRRLSQQPSQGTQHYSEQLEEYGAVAPPHRDAGQIEDSLHGSPWRASVASSGRDPSLRTAAHRRSACEDQAGFLPDTSTGGRADLSGVGGRSVQGAGQQEIRDSLGTASLTHAEAQGKKKPSCIQAGPRPSLLQEDRLTAIDPGGPPHCTSGTEWLSEEAQTSMSPVGRTRASVVRLSSSRATSCKTVDGSYGAANRRCETAEGLCESPGYSGASCAEAPAMSGATEYVAGVSKSFFAPGHVRRGPPFAQPTSVYTAEPHAAVSQPVARQRTDVCSVDAGAGLPPAESVSITRHVQTAAERPVQEASWARPAPASSCSFTRVVLPWDTDGSAVFSPKIRKLYMEGSRENCSVSGTPGVASAAAGASLAVNGDIPALGSSRGWFPTYPSCSLDSESRHELLQSTALVPTGTSVHPLSLRERLLSPKKKVINEEVRVWRSRWVLRPVLLAERRDSQWSSRSAGRHSSSASTEERRRRQLRAMSAVIGALVVLGILYRGIAIVFFSTPSCRAVSKDGHHLAYSSKYQEHPLSILTSSTAYHQVTHQVDATWVPSAIPALWRFWTKMWTPSQRRAAANASFSDIGAPLPNTGGGLAALPHKVARIAHSLLVRLSARRRRGMETSSSSSAANGWGGGMAKSGENHNHQRQRKSSKEDQHTEGTFTRARWRRREGGGFSPVKALLLYVVLFFRKMGTMLVAASRILVAYPLIYVLRSLIYLVLRISASFACTAFAFILAGRLILERLKAFRAICAAVPSASFSEAPRSYSGHSSGRHGTASGNSQPDQHVPAHVRGNTDGGVDIRMGDASDIVDVSNSSSAEFCPLGSTPGLENPPPCPLAGEESRAGAIARATPSNEGDGSGLCTAGGSIGIANVGVQNVAVVLDHLSGVIFWRGLYLGKAVVAHLFPLVSCAASAAISMVACGRNVSSREVGTSEEFRQETSTAPQQDVRVSQSSDSQLVPAAGQAEGSPTAGDASCVTRVTVS